jgi:hypothetical protein
LPIRKSRSREKTVRDELGRETKKQVGGILQPESDAEAEVRRDTQILTIQEWFMARAIKQGAPNTPEVRSYIDDKVVNAFGQIRELEDAQFEGDPQELLRYIAQKGGINPL